MGPNKSKVMSRLFEILKNSSKKTIEWKFFPIHYLSEIAPNSYLM